MMNYSAILRYCPPLPELYCYCIYVYVQASVRLFFERERGRGRTLAYNFYFYCIYVYVQASVSLFFEREGGGLGLITFTFIVFREGGSGGVTARGPASLRGPDYRPCKVFSRLIVY